METSKVEFTHPQRGENYIISGEWLELDIIMLNRINRLRKTVASGFFSFVRSRYSLKIQESRRKTGKEGTSWEVAGGSKEGNEVCVNSITACYFISQNSPEKQN